MSDVNEIIGKFVILITVAVILGVLLSYPAMLLWNGCLVPAVNGVNQISWLQAWGLMILAGLFSAKITTTNSK